MNSYTLAQLKVHMPPPIQLNVIEQWGNVGEATIVYWGNRDNEIENGKYYKLSGEVQATSALLRLMPSKTASDVPSRWPQFQMSHSKLLQGSYIGDDRGESSSAS